MAKDTTLIISSTKEMDYNSTDDDDSTSIRETKAMKASSLFPPISAIPEFLLVVSPFRRPVTWSAINVLCMIWSYILLMQFRAGEGPRETEHGNELYMEWNFWTTTLWCIEAGLCSFYHHYNRHSMRRLDSLIDLLQFIAAVYFFVDSIQLYKESRRPGEMIYGEVTDVLISFAAYLGASIYYMSLYCGGRGGNDEMELVQPHFCEREMACTETDDDKGGFCYANIT